jgi:hypothetical protein
MSHSAQVSACECRADLYPVFIRTVQEIEAALTS